MLFIWYFIYSAENVFPETEYENMPKIHNAPSGMKKINNDIRSRVSTRVGAKRNSTDNKVKRPKKKIKKYMFDDSNIKDITIKRYLGKGSFKVGYEGEYKGMRVAVRISKVTKGESACIKQVHVEKPDFLTANAGCTNRDVHAFLKEIFILHRLDHPNIAKLLGYCINCPVYDGDTLLHTGLVTVTEYGVYQRSRTFVEVLKHTNQLACLMHYFESSPLGSLRYSDFKRKHFLVFDKVLKIIDVDKLGPSVKKNSAKRNIKTMIKLLVWPWLRFTTFPKRLQSDIGRLRQDLMKMNATELMVRTERILDKCCKKIE